MSVQAHDEDRRLCLPLRHEIWCHGSSNERYSASSQVLHQTGQRLHIDTRASSLGDNQSTGTAKIQK